MENRNAIEIRNMSKSFKVQYDQSHSLKELFVRHNHEKSQRHEVLKNVSLDIKKGETVALIGVNGSGKSTLLKLMTKIIYPTSGTVKTYGKLTSLLELGAGFHPDFTGRENIYFNASIFGLTKKEIEGRMNEIIEFSELGNAIDEPIRTYSSGMYMRLAFSIAINVDAEILLIDEILAVGDQHFQEKCFEKLKELRDNENKTIVIVTHTLEVVKDLCSRAIWLYKGEFKLDGDPSYVVKAYLDQVAKDNREKKRKELANGAEHSASAWIDFPQNFTHYSANTMIDIAGWHITDDENAHFELMLGGKKVEYNDVTREDVVQMFHEQYAGFIEAEHVGFKALVAMKDFIDCADEDGSMLIVARIVNYTENKVLAEKTTKILVDKEG